MHTTVRSFLRALLALGLVASSLVIAAGPSGAASDMGEGMGDPDLEHICPTGTSILEIDLTLWEDATATAPCTAELFDCTEISCVVDELGIVGCNGSALCVLAVLEQQFLISPEVAPGCPSGSDFTGGCPGTVIVF